MFGVSQPRKAVIQLLEHVTTDEGYVALGGKLLEDYVAECHWQHHVTKAVTNDAMRSC